VSTVAPRRKKGQALDASQSKEAQREVVIYRHRMLIASQQAALDVLTDSVEEAALQVLGVQAAIATAPKTYTALDAILASVQIAVLLTPGSAVWAALVAPAVVQPESRELVTGVGHWLNFIDKGRTLVGLAAESSGDEKGAQYEQRAIAISGFVSAVHDARSMLRAGLTQTGFVVERDIRTGTFDTSLAYLADAFQPLDLRMSVRELVAVKDRLRALHELAIWALMYGYDSGATLHADPPGVPDPVVDYWRAHFPPIIDDLRSAGVPIYSRASLAVLNNAQRLMAIQTALQYVGMRVKRALGSS
jgi:hypothetical protein